MFGSQRVARLRCHYKYTCDEADEGKRPIYELEDDTRFLEFLDHSRAIAYNFPVYNYLRCELVALTKGHPHAEPMNPPKFTCVSGVNANVGPSRILAAGEHIFVTVTCCKYRQLARFRY